MSFYVGYMSDLCRTYVGFMSLSQHKKQGYIINYQTFIKHSMSDVIRN